MGSCPTCCCVWFTTRKRAVLRAVVCGSLFENELFYALLLAPSDMHSSQVLSSQMILAIVLSWLSAVLGLGGGKKRLSNEATAVRTGMGAAVDSNPGSDFAVPEILADLWTQITRAIY